MSVILANVGVEVYAMYTMHLCFSFFLPYENVLLSVLLIVCTMVRQTSTPLLDPAWAW